MELVDTHAHLNDEKFAEDLEAVIARAGEAGVTRIINLGDAMDSSARVVALAEAHEGLFAGVGIHPEDACEMTGQDIDRLAAWAEHPKVAAIGEIGL
ncbi:MAG: TatD family hydrolase, partial [Selenomonadaceae bacterium]|nr:TatD family hydrolase [Selenomonadaceae bacterium]